MGCWYPYYENDGWRSGMLWLQPRVARCEPRPTRLRAARRVAHLQRRARRTVKTGAATGRLAWHCGAHTAEPESAPWGPIPDCRNPKSPAHPRRHNARQAAVGSRQEARAASAHFGGLHDILPPDLACAHACRATPGQDLKGRDRIGKQSRQIESHSGACTSNWHRHHCPTAGTSTVSALATGGAGRLAPRLFFAPRAMEPIAVFGRTLDPPFPPGMAHRLLLTCSFRSDRVTRD